MALQGSQLFLQLTLFQRLCWRGAVSNTHGFACAFYGGKNTMHIISIQITDAADTKAANNRQFAGVDDITTFFDFLIT